MKLKLLFLSIFFLTVIYIKPLPAPPLIRISVVNWSEITTDFKWFQTQYVVINEKRQTITDMISKENEKIKKLETELKNLYLPDEISRKQSEIQRRKADLKAFYMEANDLLGKREEKLVEKSKERILDAIKSKAVSKGISLVFSKEQLLYSSEDYTDMTEEVIDYLNKKYKVKEKK